MKHRTATQILDHECTDEICNPCKKAVMRAYEGLRHAGQDHRSAFRSAVLVLSLRSPGRAKDECERLVSGWLQDKRGTGMPDTSLS